MSLAEIARIGDEMTTIEEKLRKELFDCGIFEDQCDAVMEAVKTDDYNESMLDRWQDDVDDYPPQLFVVLWLLTKQAALEYIDANCPKAWFRPMFEDVLPQNRGANK